MNAKTTHNVATKGDALSRYREIAGLTQSALAFEVGTSQRCISDGESEKRMVSIETLEKIASALGVKLSEIAEIPMNSDAPDREVELASLELLRMIMLHARKMPLSVLSRKNMLSEHDSSMDLVNYKQLPKSGQRIAWKLLSEDGWIANHDEDLISLNEDGAEHFADTHHAIEHLENLLNGQLQILAARCGEEDQDRVQRRFDNQFQYVKAISDNLTESASARDFCAALRACDIALLGRSHAVVSAAMEFHRYIEGLLRYLHWKSLFQSDKLAKTAYFQYRVLLYSSRYEIVQAFAFCSRGNIAHVEYCLMNLYRASAISGATYLVLGLCRKDKVDELISRLEDYSTGGYFTELFDKNILAIAGIAKEQSKI